MTDQQNTAAVSDEDTAPQFSLQRIYVRDLSFEAPKSPAIFRQEWTPSVALDLNTRQKALEGDFHEVVLTLSVTVKNGEEVAFIAEVQQAGIFLIQGLDEQGFKLADGLGQSSSGSSTGIGYRLQGLVERRLSDHLVLGGACSISTVTAMRRAGRCCTCAIPSMYGKATCRCRCSL